MTYSLTGASVSSTYGKLVQVILGAPNTYFDGFGNPLNIGGIGPTGADGNSIVWNGQWDPMMIYFPLDLVSYQNDTYICINSPSGSVPYSPPDVDTISWDLVIQSIIGSTGPQGITGSTGPQPNYYIQNTLPSSPSIGERWYNLSTGVESVYIYDGDNFLWLSPASAGPQGATGPPGSPLNYTFINNPSYSATTSDFVLGVDSSVTSSTIYLPDSSTSGRVRYEIKDVGLNSHNNNITVQTIGLDTIISTTISNTIIISSIGGSLVIFNTGNGTWIQM